MEVVGGVSSLSASSPAPARARLRQLSPGEASGGGSFLLMRTAPRSRLQAAARPARRAALVVEARGRGWSDRRSQQQRMPQLPKIEDDGNPRFVIFIRTANVYFWYPLNIVTGGTTAKIMLAAKDNFLGKYIYKDTLARNLAAVIYKDEDDIIDTAKEQYRRVIRLTRMSDDGKASAKSAVESLAAGGGTNILKGLVEAAKVFDGRRYRNAVASVILLSDGQDTYNVNSGWGASNSKNYSVLVPPSFKRSGDRRLPVHTFGFGTDHDAAAMHAIAEETGGTFSFIENQAVVQDAFAQCIGGLLSVTVQEARIAIACSHPGVRVRSVKSGRYESHVHADGRAASVDVGELYADEERRFLVFVDVPAAGAGEDATELIKVSCTYRDTASRQQMVVAGEDAVVQRPVEVATTMEPSMEVERERFRVEATEDIAAAQEAAERGAHAAAKAILDRRQEALARSTRGLAGDARCAALVLGAARA
ncbi:hypothetical protein OsI_07955 [Oryza sativa Indica Group]|uniref:VWFA domain-containing protein n=1 Tax=Oryza sativa subsp. indica TaxID=39946 RepID=A2X6W5_ORYSI|nr:hypothetical protein OsI_07955 [Oryza sativa Indica Group]